MMLAGVAWPVLAADQAGQTIAAGQPTPLGQVTPTGQIVAETPVATETLGQAVADAYRSNPQLEAQRAQLRAIDEQVIQAASPYRLSAGITATFAYDEQRRRDPLDDFQRLNNRQLGISLSASQILLNGGRTAAAVTVAEANVFSARERLRELENFILLEVVDAYASVRRDTALVAIQQRSVDSYSRQVQQAQARERAGDLTRTDIAQASAQLEIIRTQLIQTQADLQASRSRFASVVGRNPGTLAPEPTLPGIPGSLDFAYRVASSESPTLWQAVFNERVARARIVAERAERNPVLSVSGGYGYVAANSYSTRDLGRALNGAATLTIPILTQGVIGSRVRAAVAGQQQAEFLVEATRRSVDQQVLTSWNQSIASGNQVLAGERAVTAAEAALTGVRRGFSEGFRSNFEVLDSEQRLLNAQVILASAAYTRYVNQANLLAYVGRLQASLIVQAAPQYDPTLNLQEQRSKQFSPLQFALEPVDKLLRSAISDNGREAPLIPVATDTGVKPAADPAPNGPLGTALPVDPSGRPPLPDREALPPQR